MIQRKAMTMNKLSTPGKVHQRLFLVVLGGRMEKCHIEVHDVRWVVGKTIEETIPDLKKQWWGLRKGLHIDSYREIKEVDGYKISINQYFKEHAETNKLEKLWFVNMGAYKKGNMAEQHEFGLIVATSFMSAKTKARRKWLQGMEQLHKDDLYQVMQDGIDQLLPIEGIGQWTIDISKQRNANMSHNTAPDWYGYWPI